ncbi:MAG: CsbD family protein [Oxalobacteraceae bacterium]|nr:MAG: CsbD family protein [Oxalobacteraceae bacterium]
MTKPTKHATKQAKGSIKEAIGMLLGNPHVQAEGAAEKAEGERLVKGSPDPTMPPRP